MAEEFGNLMKNLWSGKYNWTNGNQLRVCSMRNSSDLFGKKIMHLSFRVLLLKDIKNSLEMVNMMLKNY